MANDFEKGSTLNMTVPVLKKEGWNSHIDYSVTASSGITINSVTPTGTDGTSNSTFSVVATVTEFAALGANWIKLSGTPPPKEAKTVNFNVVAGNLSKWKYEGWSLYYQDQTTTTKPNNQNAGFYSSRKYETNNSPRYMDPIYGELDAGAGIGMNVHFQVNYDVVHRSNHGVYIDRSKVREFVGQTPIVIERRFNEPRSLQTTMKVWRYRLKYGYNLFTIYNNETKGDGESFYEYAPKGCDTDGYYAFVPGARKRGIVGGDLQNIYGRTNSITLNITPTQFGVKPLSVTRIYGNENICEAIINIYKYSDPNLIGSLMYALKRNKENAMVLSKFGPGTPFYFTEIEETDSLSDFEAYLASNNGFVSSIPSIIMHRPNIYTGDNNLGGLFFEGGEERNA